MEDVNVTMGAKILCKALCQRVDNPKKNIEICVMTTSGLRYLTEQELEKLVEAIEAEEKDNMVEEK